ncbi:MAG: hypothetical protein N3G79_06340 [Sulfolobales archaeon]|nr:hypothetical protein [Sulfolobales archaeon]
MKESSPLRRVAYAAITAVILQSVWIGGGFGSGREIVEFIAKYGSIGWISILVSAVTLTIALIPSLEVARVFKAYDYMTWSKQFLWKFWWLFDIAFIVLAWIVVAVVGAAAGYMLSDLAGIPFSVSAALVIAIVGILHFFGRRVIEAYWIVGTVGLYAMYFVIWGYTLVSVGGVALRNIEAGLHMGSPEDATIDGFRYMLYNLCVVMPALESVDRYRGRMESFLATALAILLIYGAATAIWICFMAYYPEVIGMTVPWYDILKGMGAYWALAIYVFWIFYTLTETALGMVYAIVRRIDAQLKLRGRELGRKGEAVLSVVILAASILTAQVGLVALVAAGYGTMAWVFFAVYFLPIVTIGLLRLLKPLWKRSFWIKA